MCNYNENIKEDFSLNHQCPIVKIVVTWDKFGRITAIKILKEEKNKIKYIAKRIGNKPLPHYCPSYPVGAAIADTQTAVRHSSNWNCTSCTSVPQRNASRDNDDDDGDSPAPYKIHIKCSAINRSFMQPQSFRNSWRPLMWFSGKLVDRWFVRIALHLVSVLVHMRKK